MSLLLAPFQASPRLRKPLIAHVQRTTEARGFKMGEADSNPSPTPSSSVPRASYPVVWPSVSLFIKWGDIFLPFLSRPQSKNTFYVIHFDRVHINTLLCFSLTCHWLLYHDQIREGWAMSATVLWKADGHNTELSIARGRGRDQTDSRTSAGPLYFSWPFIAHHHR